MKYVSTRGSAPVLGFEDVLLTGLARDGGLYVPAQWPSMTPREIAALAGLPYAEAAHRIMHPFVGEEIATADLADIIRDSYAGFRHPAVAPLVQLGPATWLLELFHGPTLAFKDVAMQVLARLMDRTLARRSRRATIVGATSGDTGGAAIEAFRGRERVDIFILYPHGLVSDVQRRQMTTPSEANVHAIAVRGTFDDCQNIVKALFNDLDLRDRLQLAGVNSINWARLMAQIVYFFTSAVALGAPGRRISFTVPTGNFGDIFAGYAAQRMGLPIERLVIATNSNDILARTWETGRYQPKGVAATSSPSMDIQISSNFERLLFELAGRDAARVVDQMESLRAQGSFALAADEHAAFKARFDAGRADESRTKTEIRDQLARCGYLLDPHTAVGTAVERSLVRDPAVPMITLATAHPAKFPAAVAAATGHPPPEPQTIARQRAATERLHVLDNDIAEIAAYITDRSRTRSS